MVYRVLEKGKHAPYAENVLTLTATLHDKFKCSLKEPRAVVTTL